MRRLWLALAVLIPVALGVSAQARSADGRSSRNDRPAPPRAVLAAVPPGDEGAGISGGLPASGPADGRFRPQADGAFWARGAAGLLLRGDRRGVEISAPSRSGSRWTIGLSLVRFGREGLLASTGPGHAATRGDRLVIRRGDVTEWYAGAAGGAEQGFRIERRPGGPDPGAAVILEMTVESGGDPSPDGTGTSVTFRDVLGRPVLEYSRLQVADSLGRPIPAEIALAAGRLQIRIRDVGAVYPLEIDPLLAPVSPVLSGEEVGDFFGRVVASAGDVNGDGFDDVIVGAPYHDNGGFRFGRAYLFLGSRQGIGTLPAWVVEGSETGYGFAGAVAGAGDVNGDGYDDVLVSGVGRAYLFLGSPSGLSATPDWSSEDGGPGIGQGLAVAGAGDVNGDGFADLLVGSSQDWPGGSAPGTASLYLGSAAGPGATPAWTFQGDQPGAAFGYSLASAGDVNGDGYADVVVGEPGYDYPEPVDRPNAGKVLLFLGSASGLESSPAWESNVVNRYAFLGASVSGAGDVNGDGYADILMGGFNGYGEEEGIAQVYLGSPSGPLSSPAWTRTGDHALAHFGTAVAGAGDLNGDGFADIVVGEPDFDRSLDTESVGRAYVFRGSAAGLSAEPDWFAEGDEAFAMLGSAVAPAGDVNGDSLLDLLVGAPTDGRGAGRAFLYLGRHDNRPPEARIAAQPRVECTSPAGAQADLNGSGSTDADSTPGTRDDIATYEWFEHFGQPSQLLLGTGERLSVPLSLGSHAVTLRVTDRSGASGTDTATVTVADTTPPTVALRLSPALLWPPDHRMVPIQAFLDVSDACGSAGATLVSITSSEPDDAPGPADGSTVQDCQEAVPGTLDLNFLLRAERSDWGQGRTYTVTYRAVDAAGNGATAVGVVKVPLSIPGGSVVGRPPQPDGSPANWRPVERKRR